MTLLHGKLCAWVEASSQVVYDPKPGEDPRNKLARIALPPLWIHSCRNCVLHQKLEIAEQSTRVPEG